MSRRMPYADARQKVLAVLDAPRDTPISPDFWPGTCADLVSLLVRNGRSGDYGENFEDLHSPHHLGIPGVTSRTDTAILDAIAELGIRVIPDYEFGHTPTFGIGADYAAAGLVEIHGVALALVTAYATRGALPTELGYAASRIATSGTHASGTGHRIARALRKQQRNNPKESRA